MGWASTEQRRREDEDRHWSDLRSGRAKPAFMLSPPFRPVSYEVFVPSRGSVDRCETWVQAALSWGTVTAAGVREFAVYARSASGERRALVARRTVDGRYGQPRDVTRSYAALAHGDLAVGELPGEKFSKRLGIFPAERVWPEPEPEAPRSPVDFSSDPEWRDVFHGDPSPARVEHLAHFLQADPDRRLRLYHGTWDGHPVAAKGLLPTSASRRRSLQSAVGFVHLSVSPGVAKAFGETAYPAQGVAVYAVDVTVGELKPDLDELRNQRQHSERQNLGDSLAESLAFGHAARVKGPVAADRVAPVRA